MTYHLSSTPSGEQRLQVRSVNHSNPSAAFFIVEFVVCPCITMPRSKHRAGKRPDKRERERREAEQRQTENQPKALANKASEPSTPQNVDSTTQESPLKEQSERELTREQREEMVSNSFEY